MTDSGKHIVAPKQGPDDNPTMQIAGKPARMPERDGPAKRSAKPEPTAKKPSTSGKAGRMGAAKTVVKAPIKVAPKTSNAMMPQGGVPVASSAPMGPSQMPPPNMIQAMKKSLGSNKGLTR